MSATEAKPAACPFHPPEDHRKTARIVAERAVAEKDATPVTSFALAREILRSAAMKQAGGGADFIDKSDPDKAPVFFLDGEAHRRKRATIARYFTPKAIASRYRDIMEEVTNAQLSALRREGRGRLDLMSFDLAVAVAGDIVGLTVTDRGRLAKRLARTLSVAFVPANPVARLLTQAKKTLSGLDFFLNDVKPAIAARRKEPREDVISHLLKEGYSEKSILVECMTYAAAGMVTTREFIVMCAWHLFDRPDLRARFLAADEAGQFDILQEILRLEPIAAFLYRRADAEPPVLKSGKIEGGALYALMLREANFDEAAVGDCPFALDPDRARRVKDNGGYLTFGDGAHYCPGRQVALHEGRVFLDALFRVPGVRLERAPDIGWSDMLMSYELRNAVIACDRG